MTDTSRPSGAAASPNHYDPTQDRIDLGCSPVWSDFWTIRGIYASGVVLAIHVEPPKKLPERLDHQKVSLRQLARLVSQLAMEADFVRPVAVVLSWPHDAHRADVQAWEADQDWHRGGFLLYVVKDDDQARARLEDLLAPQPVAFQATEVEDRSEPALLAKLQQQPPPSSGAKGLYQSLLNAFETAIEARQARLLRGEDEAQAGWNDFYRQMVAWRDSIQDEAERLARGEV